MPLHSWGYRGQISDLARMPGTVKAGLPWIRFDMDRIYALGGSMGGQETLAPARPVPAGPRRARSRWTRSPTSIAATTTSRWPPKTRGLQALARFEVGGTPRTNPTGYVLRSPTHWIDQVARSGVPLQLWWSLADQIVLDQAHQSAHFYEQLKKKRPKGPVKAVAGHWLHSQLMRTQMPEALRFLGLCPSPRQAPRRRGARPPRLPLSEALRPPDVGFE